MDNICEESIFDNCSYEVVPYVEQITLLQFVSFQVSHIYTIQLGNPCNLARWGNSEHFQLFVNQDDLRQWLK